MPIEEFRRALDAELAQKQPSAPASAGESS
jgi:hypothetical protein